MSRRGELDVVVVGAGAVGGALALALAQDGFEVALVEAREPKPWRAEDEVDLRVVALAPDARALLMRARGQVAGVADAMTDALPGAELQRLETLLTSCRDRLR